MRVFLGCVFGVCVCVGGGGGGYDILLVVMISAVVNGRAKPMPFPPNAG